MGKATPRVQTALQTFIKTKTYPYVFLSFQPGYELVGVDGIQCESVEPNYDDEGGVTLDDYEGGGYGSVAWSNKQPTCSRKFSPT